MTHISTDEQEWTAHNSLQLCESYHNDCKSGTVKREKLCVLSQRYEDIKAFTNPVYVILSGYIDTIDKIVHYQKYPTILLAVLTKLLTEVKISVCEVTSVVSIHLFLSAFQNIT